MADNINQDGQPIKFTVTHFRKAHRSAEEFKNWMEGKHIPLAMPVFKKYGFISYSLFFTPSGINEAVKEQMSPHRPGWDFAEFDCIIEYVLPSLESISKLMTDPGWLVSIEDQEDWIDTSRALVSVGYHIPYLKENGEVVNVSK